MCSSDLREAVAAAAPPPAKEAALAAEAPAQGQVRKVRYAAPPKEKPEVVNAPAQHDHPARHDAQHGGRPVYNGKTFNQV